jgi:hypothetical protein
MRAELILPPDFDTGRVPSGFQTTREIDSRILDPGTGSHLLSIDVDGIHLVDLARIDAGTTLRKGVGKRSLFAESAGAGDIGDSPVP